MLNSSKAWTNKSAAKVLRVHFLQGNLESRVLLLWILVTHSIPQHLFEICSRQLLFWLWLRWLKHRTNRLLYIGFPRAMNIFINSLGRNVVAFRAQPPQHCQAIWLVTGSGGQAWGDDEKMCLLYVSSEEEGTTWITVKSCVLFPSPFRCAKFQVNTKYELSA